MDTSAVSPTVSPLCSTSTCSLASVGPGSPLFYPPLYQVQLDPPIPAVVVLSDHVIDHLVRQLLDDPTRATGWLPFWVERSLYHCIASILFQIIHLLQDDDQLMV